MAIKQITVDNVYDALVWIDTQAHHLTEIEGHVYDVNPGYTHFTMSNYHSKMRIPYNVHQRMVNLVEPNKRAFDTRMFALNNKGRAYLLAEGKRRKPVVNPGDMISAAYGKNYRRRIKCVYLGTIGDNHVGVTKDKSFVADIRPIHSTGKFDEDHPWFVGKDYNFWSTLLVNFAEDEDQKGTAIVEYRKQILELVRKNKLYPNSVWIPLT